MSPRRSTTTRSAPGLPRAAGIAAAGLQLATWLPVAHLALVTVAGLRRQASVGQVPPTRRFVVLVPAHDEEGAVAATVTSLLGTRYPASRRRVIVIADNCTDRTAELARAAGAEVWERNDPGRGGKGAAIRWALACLDDDQGWDAMVLVDADTLVDPGLLGAFDARLAAGAHVVQGEYRVSNAHESVVSRLAEVSFAMQSVLRTRGRAALGGAGKLQGNGMAFTRETLQRCPWRAEGLAEDVEQWFELLEQGVRPVFAPEAKLAALMPTGLRAAWVQRARWEAGRAATGRRRAWPDLRLAARRRDPVLAEAVVSELLMPPVAMIAAAVVAGGGARWLVAGRGARTAAAQSGVLTAHALVALAVARAPLSAYLALTLAPLVVAWKVVVKLAILRPDRLGWQRTPRGAGEPGRDR